MKRPLIGVATCPDCGRTVLANCRLYSEHYRFVTDRKKILCTASLMPLVTELRQPNEENCKGK